MQINLKDIDLEQFNVNANIIGDETVYLVTPKHIGIKWTQQNKIFRSSLWGADGNLISGGLPKFCNYGENPEQFPLPKSLKNTTIVEKIDGSLLPVTKYKGNFIIRTRGTVDASKLDNGHEIQIFRNKYLPKLSDLCPEDTWDYTFLFEWTSPLNKIILNYGEQPEWYLVGYIIHDTYSLLDQKMVSMWAERIGCPRPPTYTFPTLEELLKDVEQWKGKEGVCLYSNNGQTIHKIKGFWYLQLHHMKSELSNFEKVIDVWIALGKPTYTDFYNKIAAQFDFELANQIQGDISRICDAWKEVVKVEAGMDVFVQKIKTLPTRKEQALKIISAYGNTNRSNFLFKKLDLKPLVDDDYKKLIFQILKK
jgi:hypothetical protein